MSTEYNKENYSLDAKRQRFLRVAERRTNSILETIRLLGNTSNKNLYQYSDSDVEKIFSTVDEKLKEAKLRFKTDKKRERFTLDDSSH